jgi:secreted trypsin-like serine protease
MGKSFLSLLLITSLSAGFVGCSRPSPAQHELTGTDHFDVINGTKAPSESAIARSTVYISTWRGTCTGILLNDHVVLTAAHCDASRATIVGFLDRQEDCSKAEVSEVAASPKVAGNRLPTDLQLLKLKSPVCKPATVVLAPAPTEGDVIKSAGFGKGTTPGAPDLLDLTVYSSKESLQALYMNDSLSDVGTQDHWKELSSYYADLIQTSLFAISNHSDQSSCNGDSGGPYFNEKDGVIYLYGIHSAAFPHPRKGTEGCFNLNYVHIFTLVEPSMDWITQQLNEWK